MSVVVAIKENNVVYIGADSQCTAGYSKYTLTNKNNFKIWEVKDTKNILMGAVGSLRELNAIAVSNEIVPELLSFKKEIGFDNVVKIIVPNLFRTAKDAGIIVGKEGKILELNNSYLLAASDKLFCISQNGCVVEIDDYAAIGCGEEYAIGSLGSTMGKAPRERIIEAIKVASKNSNGVGYPIIISDTKSMKFEIIDE